MRWNLTGTIALLALWAGGAVLAEDGPPPAQAEVQAVALPWLAEPDRRVRPVLHAEEPSTPFQEEPVPSRPQGATKTPLPEPQAREPLPEPKSKAVTEK